MNASRIRRGSGILFLLGVTLFLIHSPVGASSQSHDEGFFLRLSAGGASAKSAIDFGNGETSLTGYGADLDIAIGAIVSPNLAVHGTLFGWSISNPEWEYSTMTQDVDGTLTLGCVGGGFTYYVMPVNIYFSASAGLGSMSISFDDEAFENDESDMGYAFDFCVGKEWWAGDNWAFGVAGGLTYHSIPASVDNADFDENWSGPSYGIRFTATRN